MSCCSKRAIKIREGSRLNRVAKSRSVNKIAESEENTRKVQKKIRHPGHKRTSQNYRTRGTKFLLNVGRNRPEPKQDDTSTIQEIIRLFTNLHRFTKSGIAKSYPIDFGRAVTFSY